MPKDLETLLHAAVAFEAPRAAQMTAIAALRDAPMDELASALFDLDVDDAPVGVALLRHAGRHHALVDWLVAHSESLNHAATFVAAIGRTAERCVPGYEALLGWGSEPWEVVRACEALGSIGAVGSNGIQALRRHLRGPDGDKRIAASQALAGLAERVPDLREDLIAVLEDDYRYRNAVRGIERYGLGPGARAAIEQAGLLVAARAAAGFRREYPRDIIERSLEDSDEIRAVGREAIVALAEHFEEAAVRLKELVLALDDIDDPLVYAALKAVGTAKLDDATRFELYRTMLTRPGFASLATRCLPPGAFPYDADATSGDGALGVNTRLARDRESYLETDLDYEVTVFALDTRRVISRSGYSVSASAAGRRGRAPTSAVFGTEAGTVVVTFDDGATETIRYDMQDD